jgi:arginyl-tRNA--protein-N-Asp/Glu arginylyltransferase
MEKETTSPDHEIDTKVYFKQHFPDKLQPTELDVYLANGWFRSQNRVYTCTHIKYDVFWKVDRVWWLRFPINEIGWHKSHDKIKSRNNSFHVKVQTLESITDEMEGLFLKYRSSLSFIIDKTIVELLWKDLNTPRITD